MSNELLKAMEALAPNGAPTSAIKVSRRQRDTIEDARQKVVDKLNENIRYLKSGKEGEAPDFTHKRGSDGTFAVGAKYGNRWLPNLFGEGRHLYSNVEEASLIEALSSVARVVESGDCDSDILLIQETNAKRKRVA